MTEKLPPPPGGWFDELWPTFSHRPGATTFPTPNNVCTYPLRVDMPSQPSYILRGNQATSSIDYECRCVWPSVYKLHARIPVGALHVAPREGLLRPPSITTYAVMIPEILTVHLLENTHLNERKGVHRPTTISIDDIDRLLLLKQDFNSGRVLLCEMTYERASWCRHSRHTRSRRSY